VTPTVTRNAQRAGVEIRFQEKPPDYVRQALVGAGWRFSRFSRCWWKKATVGTWAEAHRLAGVPLAEEAE